MLAGDTVFGMFLFDSGPYIAEVVARTGLDWVLVDLEHGSADESDLVGMMSVIRGAGASPLVRVERGERIRVGRALDRGAQGVMVPQVHSAEHARDVSRWMRTKPDGDRGIALFTPGMRYGEVTHDDVARVHESFLTLVQVESPDAVNSAEAIAAVDGIDVLFVGPADLSHSMAIPGRIDDPAYEDAIERVSQAAHAHGKAAGVLVWNPADVRGYAARGYSVFALAAEVTTLDRAIRAALDTARQAASAATTPEVV